MLLRIYWLQDSNVIELGLLIYGNRLIKAIISLAEEPDDLWSMSAAKDKLWRQGICAEVAPEYPENTEQFKKQLEDEGMPLPTDQADQHTSTFQSMDDSKLQGDKRSS